MDFLQVSVQEHLREVKGVSSYVNELWKLLDFLVQPPLPKLLSCKEASFSNLEKQDDQHRILYPMSASPRFKKFTNSFIAHHVKGLKRYKRQRFNRNRVCKVEDTTEFQICWCTVCRDINDTFSHILFQYRRKDKIEDLEGALLLDFFLRNAMETGWDTLPESIAQVFVHFFCSLWADHCK